MPGFTKGGSVIATPFGKNVFLRSTIGVRKSSHTVAASTVTAQTINGAAGQKILQPGTVMAKITSGVEIGKIGPFQRGTGAAGSAGVNEVQSLTEGGTVTGGTFTLSFGGETTTAIAYNATGVTIQAALESLAAFSPGDITVTGGASGPWTLTFGGQYAATDVAQITVTSALTGTAPTITAATTTNGVAAGTLVGAATDGRGDPVNIVGLNTTFLPWQLIERDVEVAVAYVCTAVQGWCFEYSAAGVLIPLTNQTADQCRSTKGLDILFK